MDIFSRLTTGPVISRDQYDFFIKFIKLKPSFFLGIYYEDVYAFIVEFFWAASSNEYSGET